MMINNKKGFGLIELMISILVASIIVAGLYQLLTSSWLNFGISSATARSGKSARQVDNIVNSLVLQAGYLNYRMVSAPNKLQRRTSAFSTGTFFDNAAAWESGYFVVGGQEVNGNSSIKFRFTGSSLEDDFEEEGNKAANGYIFDCRGQSVPNTVELEMILFVNDQGLVCAQSPLKAPNAAAWTIPVDNPQIIDHSIVAMKVLYGTTLYGNGDTFYTADAVDAGRHWPYINLLKYYFVTSQPTGQRMVRSNAASVNMQLFTPNDFVSTQTPCPAPAVREKLEYSVQCMAVDGSSYADFGTYVIPANARTNMHKVISGSVSLFNSLNFE